MMKKIYKSLISFALLFGIIFSLSGCVKGINAYDLMEGVKAESVEGKALDDIYYGSQFNLSVELFKASTKESANQNVLVSPLSVLLALAMTANGADGQTKTEMESVLGNGIPVEELNEYIYTYVNSLSSNKDYKFKIANSIWFNDNEYIVDVNQKFLQTNANYYNAQLYKTKFNQKALNDINNWCDIHTDGMIKEILDNVSADDIMYLINAIVFDAKWGAPFKKEDVSNGKFNSIKNIQQDVTMMSSDEYIYLQELNEEGEIITEGFIKNYMDRKYSFAALLPPQHININDFINELTGERLMNILENQRNTSLSIVMPKFTHDYEINLNEVLKGLGMTTAFDSDNANFSKMGTSNLGNIYIGEVIHKTFIEVSELGTKAGAVTSVGMKAESSEPTGYRVVLDRPFVYMILDNETNLPIFIGVVMEV